MGQPYTGQTVNSGPGSTTIDLGPLASDTVDIPGGPVRVLWSEVGGRVDFIAQGDPDTAVRTRTLAVGGVFDRLYVRRVMATNTASGLKAAGALTGIV